MGRLCNRVATPGVASADATVLVSSSNKWRNGTGAAIDSSNQVRSNERTPMRLFAVAVLLVATAACSAPSEIVAREIDGVPLTANSVAEGVDSDAALQAVDVALRDERFDGLLASHAHHVAEVAEPRGSGQRGLVVTVEFEQPLGDDATYPLDMCAIDTEGQPITGVVWLVQGDRVAAVSPRWGEDIACGY